jgi:hypothetical protein
VKSIQSVFALAFLALGMGSASAASAEEALPDPPTRLQDVPFSRIRARIFTGTGDPVAASTDQLQNNPK